MTSNINFALPAAGNALTSDVRSNFQIASTEITTLQNAVAAFTGTGGLSANLSAIAGLSGNGVIALTATGVATLYSISTLSQTLLAQSSTGTWQSTLGLGTAATLSSTAFAPANYSTLSGSNLPAMTAATSGSAGTKGAVPAPSAGQQTFFLRGDATFTGIQGTVTGGIAGGYQLYSQAFFDNPRYKFIDNGNSGSSINVDISAACIQKVTLTSATPTVNIINWGVTGQVFELALWVFQDGTGSRVPTFTGTGGTVFKYVSGNQPQWSTTASAVDVIGITSFDGGVTAYVFVAGVSFR